MKSFLFLFLLTLGFNVLGQKQNVSSNKLAQKSYDQANQSISYKLYDKAVDELKKTIALDAQFAAAYQQLGDVYRKIQNYTEAKNYYKKLLSINPEFNPLTYYGLAESELYTGDYENALQNFKKYATYPTLSAASKKLVAKYIRDCEFSLTAIKNPVVYQPKNLGNSINTAAQEYLPVVTADEATLIYTRNASNNEDFYFSNQTEGNWQKAQNLSNVINTPMYNEGAQCISPDGMYLFFTGCNRPEGNGSCDIYISRREGKGWSKPFNIGPPVNTTGWDSQPSLSADGRTLYFVSTRPRGYGGYDIWKSDLGTGGSWSEPVNLGPDINTAYDEQSPFIHPDDQTLYFSSNGWPGLGNKDIYVSRKDSGNSWQKPENLGYPINTFNEESSLTISSNGLTAFFASNQKGGFGGLDIYSFELPKNLRPGLVTYVKGIVTDNKTNLPLDAKVQIVNLTTGKPVYDDIADYETGGFLATMVVGDAFALNVSKDGYIFFSENFTLDQKASGKPYLIKVGLQKIEVGSSVVLKNIFFESNKFDLLPESKVELQQLISFLEENPKVAIEINGHTDNVGDEKSNQLLSENRAKSVYNYLLSNQVNPKRLTYKGLGEEVPVADNSSEEGRKSNRRTEFRITGK